MEKQPRRQKIIFAVLPWYFILINFSVSASETCPSMCSCGMLISKIAVNCENKNLFEFPRNISRSTEFMRLRGNFIANLPGQFYTKWPNTSMLSMEMNRISSIQDGAFMNLKHLDEVFLFGNRIRSLGKRLFAGTAPGVSITLQLENNLIEKISDNVFQDSPSKFRLFWNSNQIKHLSPGVFKGAEGIQYLNLEHNIIRTLKPDIFKDLAKLYYLGLANNNISVIEPGAFRGLHTVETLTLQRNRLSSLPEDVFKDLTFVRDIHLEENLFSNIPVGVIRSLPSFVKVRLKKNPIICTCSMKKTLSEAAVKQKIVDINEIKCQNVNMTLLYAITSFNCDLTTSKTLSPTQALKTKHKKDNIESNPYSPPISFAKNKSEHHKSTLSPNLITKMKDEQGYDKQPHLPLIIGATTGTLIIVVVIILFVYLYRRPIAARATTTLSLTRKRKNTNSTAYVYHYPNNDYTVDYNI